MKKSKIRTILVLAGTLIIGFVLGMLTSVQIRHAQLKKFRSFASQEGFGRWTLHVVNPTPEQKQQLMPVIKKYAEKNLELRWKYKKDFLDLMKDYKKELYPLLTPEQIQRLETMTHARPGWHHSKGKRVPPPGGKEPPPPQGGPGNKPAEGPFPYYF